MSLGTDLIPLISFKLKYEAAPAGSAKQKTLLHQGANYLYRCELPLWRGIRVHRLETKSMEADMIPWQMVRSSY